MKTPTTQRHNGKLPTNFNRSTAIKRKAAWCKENDIAATWTDRRPVKRMVFGSIEPRAFGGCQSPRAIARRARKAAKDASLADLLGVEG